MCYPKKRLYSPCESWGHGIRGCPLTCHLRARGLECYCFLQRGSILRLSVQAIRAGKNSPPSAFKTFFDLFRQCKQGWDWTICYFLKSDSLCGMFLSCIDSADIFSHILCDGHILAYKIKQLFFTLLHFLSVVVVFQRLLGACPYPGVWSSRLGRRTERKERTLLIREEAFRFKFSPKWAITQ